MSIQPVSNAVTNAVTIDFANTGVTARVASSCHKHKKVTLCQTYQKGQKRGLKGVAVKNEIKEE